MRYMNGRKMMSALLFAVLCMTGCGKQQEEEVPVETAPPIEAKSEVLGGTKTGYEEEIAEAETALKKGIVSYYANDMETFVASTDVDVLFTMMYGEAPNQTELIASLKKRLPVPIYDGNSKKKIIDYTYQAVPNDRVIDEETGEILALDWLAELESVKPETVTVTTTEANVISAEHPIWILFQGKYYDSETEWAYRKKKTVMPYNPEEVYEVDKAYEITYILGTHDEETDTDIETEHTGYAVHINGEWRYEIAVEQTDAVFQQYLKESGLDESGHSVTEENPDEESGEDGGEESPDIESEGSGEESES